MKDLINILERDAELLKVLQLIDYSLLILKVDWKKFSNDTGKSVEEFAAQLPS